jgi:hypothetical protein
MMSRTVQVRPAALLLAAVVSVSTPVQAQLRNHLYDKWQVSGGASLLIYSTTFRFDPADGGGGTTINGEDALGLDRNNLRPRLAGRWRPGRRHELELAYQWATRSGEKVLEDTISVGDSVFDAGLRVNTIFNTNQLFLDYRFAIKATEATQLGVAVGTGMIFLEESISAVAGATGGGQDTLFVPFGQSKPVDVPTGSLGLFGRFRLGERWYLEADARGLWAKVDNVTAEVFEGDVAFRYFPSDRLAVELGYGAGYYAVTVDRAGWLLDVTGRIKYSVQGVRASVVFVP